MQPSKRPHLSSDIERELCYQTPQKKKSRALGTTSNTASPTQPSPLHHGCSAMQDMYGTTASPMPLPRTNNKLQHGNNSPFNNIRNASNIVPDHSVKMHHRASISITNPTKYTSVNDGTKLSTAEECVRGFMSPEACHIEEGTDTHRKDYPIKTPEG